jgi:protein-serine/threonine kinase
MLAGYMPFDINPVTSDVDKTDKRQNIILLVPLTFPNYVTPHSIDLLRRVIVSDPLKRADLFEVARHSWLSDYAHILSFILR